MASTSAQNPPLTIADLEDLTARLAEICKILSDQRRILHDLHTEQWQLDQLLLTTNDPAVYNTSLDALRSTEWKMAECRVRLFRWQ